MGIWLCGIDTGSRRVQRSGRDATARCMAACELAKDNNMTVLGQVFEVWASCHIHHVIGLEQQLQSTVWATLFNSQYMYIYIYTSLS